MITATESARRTREETKRLQVEVVKQDWRYISNFEYPCEEACIEAVKQEAYAINFIKNPSELVQIIAAEKAEGWEIPKWVSNLCEDAALIAVTSEPHALAWMENKTHRVMLRAVSLNGWAIQHIDDPSEELQTKAVQSVLSSILVIDNARPAVIDYVCNIDPRYVYYRHHPRKDMSI